jgi:hypothetical protein
VVLEPPAVQVEHHARTSRAPCRDPLTTQGPCSKGLAAELGLVVTVAEQVEQCSTRVSTCGTGVGDHRFDEVQIGPCGGVDGRDVHRGLPFPPFHGVR